MSWIALVATVPGGRVRIALAWRRALSLQPASSALLAVSALVLAACFDDESEPSPTTPSPTATAEEATPSPTASAEPSATTEPGVAPPLPGYPPSVRSGDPTVDALIEARLANDIDALLDLARYEEQPCVLESPNEGRGLPPLCSEGTPEGTVLPVMVTSGCHGVLRTPEDLELDLRLARSAIRLYAVATPAEAAGDDSRVLLFAVRPDGQGDVFGYAFISGRGGFTGLNLGCGSGPDELLERYATGPFLLDPPTTEATSAALGDGTIGYHYQPQLSYVDDSGDAWLVDVSSGAQTLLMEACGGVEHAKDGTPTSGLVWSADGTRVACLRTDGSVLATNARGMSPTAVFAPGTCWIWGDVSWAPDSEHLACVGGEGGSPTIEVHVADARRGALFTVRSDTAPTAYAWDPSGRFLLYVTPPVGNRGTYAVVDTTGQAIAAIEDARVGLPHRFAWTRDGSTIAYPSDEMLALHGLPGWDGPTFDTAAYGEVHFTLWALGDSGLLLSASGDTLLLDATTGDLLTNDFRGFLGAVSPDGRYAVFVTGDRTGSAEVVNLESGERSVIADLDLSGPGLGPAFTFAGDGRRLCWIVGLATGSPAGCAALDGTDRFTILAPLQVDTAAYQARGGNDPNALFAALSPDLTRVAYNEPGPGDAAAPQVLWVSDLDGGNAIEIGPAIGAFSAAWRPDGVHRQPSRH